MLVDLSRSYNRVWKVQLIYRIRELLGLKAKSAVLLIYSPFFANQTKKSTLNSNFTIELQKNTYTYRVSKNTLFRVFWPLKLKKWPEVGNFLLSEYNFALKRLLHPKINTLKFENRFFLACHSKDSFFLLCLCIRDFFNAKVMILSKIF